MTKGKKKQRSPPKGVSMGQIFSPKIHRLELDRRERLIKSKKETAERVKKLSEKEKKEIKRDIRKREIEQFLDRPIAPRGRTLTRLGKPMRVSVSKGVAGIWRTV